MSPQGRPSSTGLDPTPAARPGARIIPFPSRTPGRPGPARRGRLAAGLLLCTSASLALWPSPAGADDAARKTALQQSLDYELSGVDKARGAFSGRARVRLDGCQACVVVGVTYAAGGVERLQARGEVVQGTLRAPAVPAREGLVSVLAGFATPAPAAQATLEMEVAGGLIRTRLLDAAGQERSTAEGKVLPELPSPWSEEERRTFHHRTQGVNILPLAWLQALESADGSGPFAAPENLRKFGIIPDPQDPQGLPVGFAVQGPLVGLTCAACHTTQLDFQGRQLRIEGGRGSIDIEAFRGALGQALGATATAPDRFQRFAARVAGSTDPQALAAVGQALEGYLEEAKRGAELSQQLGLRAVAWGYGRVDAFGNGSNQIFGPLTPKNLQPVDAPVRLPYLWRTHELTWVQYNAGIRQPLARNLSASIAAGASLSLTGPAAFETGARVEDLHALESAMSKLQAPQWPGFIDPQAWSRGRVLYQQECARCHDAHYVRSFTGRDLEPVLTPLEVIGTDPGNARAFQRTVDASAIGLSAQEPVANALRAVTESILARQFGELDLSRGEQRRFTRSRKNDFRALSAYRARPLDGIWAVGPYLHNGSVRTLYQLLSPREERQGSFRIGPTPSVDLREVGQLEPQDGGFLFRTSEPGNANTGHEHRDGPRTGGVIGRGLTPAERWDLIEYLKSL